MTTYSYAQLEGLWIQAGGNKALAPLAAAIAMAESSGRETVTSSNPDGGTNVGPWQLDTKGKGAGYTVAQLSDGLTNARVTVKASNNGTDWSAWETYVTGAYKRFLQGSVPATLTSVTPGSGSGSGSSSGLQVGTFGAGVSAASPLLGSMLGGVSWISGIGSEVDSVAKGIAGISNDISQAMNWASFLFMPSSWLRVGAFFAGVILLMMGAVMLAKSTGAMPSAPSIVPIPV